MGKFFLTVKETLMSIYEVEADSKEAAVKEYEDGGNFCLYESATIKEEIIGMSKYGDKEDVLIPVFCDHCGAELNPYNMNWIRTKNGKTIHICNDCVDSNFTNEEWENLVELLSRV